MYMKIKQTTKLWGAAFTGEPDAVAAAFTAGRDVAGIPPADAVLVPYDLLVNQAHTVMLAKTGIIPRSDAGRILSALSVLAKKVHQESFELDPAKEDVHTNIESWLTQRIGIAAAGKLHTARSRNDQVLTDMKLYLRDSVLSITNNCIILVHSLLELADETKGVLMPGYTHHQHAMGTTLGHTLAGFAAMIIRDITRFTQWHDLHNSCPLGGTVSYGTAYPIDRKMTASLLGFDGPDHNSLDAITNRWESESDFVFAVAVFMNHLSLISETLILFSTAEFGMITLADAYSTGSSIMPQKKNPDPLEVIKGKTAFAHGQLTGLLAMGKGNFMGYNRDSQWAKYMVMDVIRECLPAPVVLSGVIRTMTIHADAMAALSTKGFVNATALMEQMAMMFHLPMRTAKVIVENAVKKSVGMQQITHAALAEAIQDEGLSLSITPAQVAAWQDPSIAVGRMKSYGGPGKNSMKSSLKTLHKKLAAHVLWLSTKQQAQHNAHIALEKAINSVMKGGEKL